MSDVDPDGIAREVDGGRGRHVLHRDGHVAELAYSVTSPTLIIADHTAVPEALRGTGAGQALVRQIVDGALAEGVRIVPLCPFVNAQRRRHPEWAAAFRV